MKKVFRKKSDIVVTAVLGFVTLLLTVVLAVGNPIAFVTWDGALTSYFGFVGGSELDADTNQYFERKAENMDGAYLLSQQVSIEAVGEGAVLLKNENNALPLEKGDKVSCFSPSSVEFIRSAGGGSGSIDATVVDSLQSSLGDLGIEVNPTLWNFYKGKTSYRRKIGGLAQGVSYHEAYSWGINEVPQSEYTPDVINSYGAYNDAAIVVISRSGCENGDLPRSMSGSTGGKNTGSILELDPDEKDMLRAACDNFDRVIVIINASNPMELGFIDEYGVDACLWISGIGQYGMISVAAILAGKLSPSGRLVDTYAYDVFSSPAMQNMGNYEYFYNGAETEHHYLTYAEGIYVGYKYYETRYEDKVLGRANIGEYDYDSQVQFPFGYGMSYTKFDWSGFKTERNGDTVTVEVTVRNIGSRPGKDVVEIYYQAPYTQYDIDNRVEKAAVNLVAFGKTRKLQPGDSQTLKMSFDIEDMKSYDQFGHGTYLLEEGKYYVTAASDAHKAVNNVLKKKNADVEGNAGFVSELTVSEKLYDIDNVSKNPVGNLFADCDGTDYHDNIKYLTRNNWAEMDNNGLRVGTPTAQALDMEGEEFRSDLKAELKTKLETMGYAASGAPDEDFIKPTTSSGGTHKLIELQNKPFDDPAWGELLDQLSVGEMTKVARLSGYKTYDMDSVSKPYTTDIDGPAGFGSFIGDGIKAGGLPFEIVIASTWNEDLAYRIGDVMGELCLWVKINNDKYLTGWYAPAMNIHRTPFGGRNFEYYSEDAVLSAKIGAAEVKGVSDRGVICFIKHFAMNEQERNRMTDNVTWTREQGAREIYFKPFEDSIKKGGARAVMTSYNRIGYTWAGNSYNLITGLMRKEWGFNGYVLTDYMDGEWENVDQMLAAGGDAALNTKDTGGQWGCQNTSAQSLTYLRRSAHHILYATVNSNAMNGIDGGTVLVMGTPKYHYIMLGIDLALGLGIAACIMFTCLKLFVFGRKTKAVADTLETAVEAAEVDKEDGE